MHESKKGLLIVLDGTDGTGKGTQTELLVKRLKKARSSVVVADYPRYGERSATMVEDYLNGKFGTSKEVGPYRASLFFAMDRFAGAPAIEKALDAGRIVIANRYVSANMGHQGAMIANQKERKEFFAWVTDLEYGIFGIPEPDATIVLHVPAHIAQTLVDRKQKRTYLKGKKRDLLEDDLKHLEAAEQTYLEIARVHPNTTLVECMDGRRLMTVNEVHERVWRIVEKIIRSS